MLEIFVSKHCVSWEILTEVQLGDIPLPTGEFSLMENTSNVVECSAEFFIENRFYDFYVRCSIW